MITVEVTDARSERLQHVVLHLREGACVGDAVSASGLWRREHIGVARFGQRVEPGVSLADGDRLDLLRALQADPKQARRRRAAAHGAAKPGPR